MSELTLRLADGTLIVLPASLDVITTYVLLEQEAWFEKEAGFVPRLLKRGMTAIDIGANAGVYSLPLARRVGPEGAVYAYEPASAPRRLLEQSRALNGVSNLHIVAAALSDRPREGHLGFGFSSELHSLGRAGDGEAVAITSLDEEDRIRNWGSPDFVKLDAEGEEARILEGGQGFFTRHSPLVMFETKAGETINETIVASFRALGYRIFRLIPGAPLLVPAGPADSIDPYEFNLFAAKPDRVAALLRDRWLVAEAADWSPDNGARARAMDLLAAQIFSPVLAGLRAPPMGSSYRDALAGYALWRSPEAPLSLRYGALRFSYNTLRDLCDAEPGPARLSTLARVAWELGERKIGVVALGKALALGEDGGELTEPFWPASPRFDSIAPGNKAGQWFVVSLLEQLERTSAHSSFYVTDGLNLDWLRSQPFVSAEMLRRHMLKQLRAGNRLAVPERLRIGAEDHINADLWRSGAIPNTLRTE